MKGRFWRAPFHRGFYTATPVAKTLVVNRVQQWNLYLAALRSQLLGYARLRSAQLGIAAPADSGVSPNQKKYESVVPAIASSIRGREFQISGNEQYGKYLKEHPDALKAMGLSLQQAPTILNYINGKRSIIQIRNSACGELDEDISLEAVAAYLELLKSVGWVTY